MSSFPEMFAVGLSGGLHRLDPKEYDNDPRGIVWMWEPPSRGSLYVMGIDPTVGRTNWNRYARTESDRNTDNGAIEIIRVGKNGQPDKQVCEYAAPIDPFELGDVANILGRLYSGTEDDQCKSILEVQPGPGIGTMQRMIEHGYVNHWMWEYYGEIGSPQTRSAGWHATPRSNRDLWVKASRHIVLKNVIVRSPFLVEEYADCRMNPEKQWAENPGGHDDRVRAMNLAIWCANGWSINVERTSEPVRTSPVMDYQASDMSWDEIQDHWDAMLDRMSD